MIWKVLIVLNAVDLVYRICMYGRWEINEWIMRWRRSRHVRRT